MRDVLHTHMRLLPHAADDASEGVLGWWAFRRLYKVGKLLWWDTDICIWVC